MRTLILLLLMVPTAAAAAGVKGEKGLPFAYSLSKIEQVQANGNTYSVITATLKNNDEFFLNSVKIHCKAGNKDGFTWSMRGEANNIDVGETRSFKLISMNALDEYSRNGDRAKCVVSQYEISAY